MFEVQAALDGQKEQFEKNENNFMRREEELQRRDLQLQESLVRFNKFLRENDHKRIRALKKALEEEKIKKAKGEEALEITAKLSELKRKRHELEKEVTLEKKYQEFLENTAESNDDYSDVSSLISRYDTLSQANVDLRGNAKQLAKELEEMRTRLQKFTEERTFDNLEKTNLISHLKDSLEEKRAEFQRAQMEVEATLMVTQEKSLQLGQIEMAIANIHERSRKLKASPGKAVGGGDGSLAPPGSKADVKYWESQLDAIAHRITDMTAIVHSRQKAKQQQDTAMSREMTASSAKLDGKKESDKKKK
jgi:hypothetical protein